MIIKTYVVEGMTCNGCKTEVEEKISAIPAVVNVSVNLQDKKATIKATNAVDNGELQSVLPAKYKVNEYPTNSILDNNERDTISKIKQLTPLFLIFIYIISGVLLIHRESFNPTEMMMDFMGLFFITFSFFKILDLKGFSKSFQLYDPLAKVLPGYAMVYPFIEITLGLLFLLQTYIIFCTNPYYCYFRDYNYGCY